MSGAILMSPGEAAPKIAEAFEDGAPCSIAAREDRAFKDGWLPLGVISLQLESKPESRFRSSDLPVEPAALVGNGAFEWRLPDAQDVRSALSGLLGIKEEKDKGKKDRDSGNLSRALDEIASIGVRTGLLHPVFDPSSLEEMPYRRSTTVVSDTSGALQGALDFVVRHLPIARIKIPAIVQMEFSNLTHRFFSLRRKHKDGRRIHELIEHLKSQGGQRTLLRLELQADTEIERTYLLGDPLRSAFQPERDSELSGLDISVSVPEYVDRLILEAARHHQAQSGPNHAVRLLTGDQGLARMALAEGVTPLYFRSVGADDFFGRRLTGQTFDPFTGHIRRTSLALVLWELATAFGSARLEGGNGSSFTVSALGEGMPWSPYHSVDDLLWCEQARAGTSGESSNPVRERTGTRRSGGAEMSQAETADTSGDVRRAVRKVSFQVFDVGRLLRLICALDDDQEMSELRVMELLGAQSPRGGGEYRRFLSSAGLVSVTNGAWKAEPPIQPLSAALRNERVEELRDALLEAPSFSSFATHIRQSKVGHSLDLPGIVARGANNYRILGEITLMCALVRTEGLYPTPAAPDAATFAHIALDRFSELDRGDGLVATGAWLELLIRKDGIHPEVARRRLDEASTKDLLHRSTEGSTTQVRFDDHVVHVLRTNAGLPVVTPIHLYRGDYLIPGKGSTSLRIEGSTP